MALAQVLQATAPGWTDYCLTIYCVLRLFYRASTLAVHASASQVEVSWVQAYPIF